MRSAVRFAALGACAALSLGVTAVAGVAALGPETGALAPLTRVLDALAPALLALGLVFGLAVAALGAPMIGAALAVLAGGAGAALLASYLEVTQPVLRGAEGELRVLFLNAYENNATDGARIVSAAIAEAPDIAVFAEAEVVAPAREALRSAFPFVSPCPAADCQLLVASRLPVVRFWVLALNPVWPPRYAVLEVERAPGSTVFVVVSHLVKPWMSGIAEGEREKLVAQFNWLIGPSTVVGDFNMTPWSVPMRRILAQTGFRALRGQPGSWPASAGRFGLPIDQVLVRGGMRVTRIAPFGGDLGSNHRGFIADLALERE